MSDTVLEEWKSARQQKAEDSAPVEIGDEVLIHMISGCGAWSDKFPLTYEVISISPPQGLSCRNDYILRVRHEDPPYMADGYSDSTICEQLRRGNSWEVANK